MAEMKTHCMSAKRFRRTGTGRLRKYKAYKSHITGKKSPKRTRNLHKEFLASKNDQRRVDHVIL